jgi:osmotically-inducible protein OsmY
LANCSKTDQQAAKDKVDQSTAAVEQKMEQAGEAISDVGLTAKVKTALIAEPNLSAMSINVDTSERVVTLSGECETQAQADRAVAIAQSIEGVRTVKNNLKLKTQS